ncbi:hypothetical protein R1sor_015085 [Riccia sorocarpa]|uniref:Endonuclease/exonuclease/phosphatase domain-containing protein n=1 Tax=Riccia sorocarpa TaxID=122646 RepID=A0ABD3HD36_9MARC
MEAGKKDIMSEEQLVLALKKISLQRDVAEREGRPVITVSKRQGFKGIREQMERGVLSFYLDRNQAIGPFRNWAIANWAKKLRVTVESVQESGNRGILTMFKTKQDRDKVLANIHPNIRGCTVAHLSWGPEMDMPGYTPKMEVEVCDLPKWTKNELSQIFLSLGPVISFPQETRDLVQKNAVATILWDEEKPLPDSVFVTLAGCDYKCPLKKVEATKEAQDGDDSGCEGEGPDGDQNKQSEETVAEREGSFRGISGSNNVYQKNREGSLEDTAQILPQASGQHSMKGHTIKKGAALTERDIWEGPRMLPGVGGNFTQQETNAHNINRWELDLNIVTGETDASQNSRTTPADNGGDTSHMFVGVKVLRQLEYGVLLDARDWVNDALYQKMDSTPRTATLEEIETGQESGGTGDLDGVIVHRVPDLNMEEAVGHWRKREDRGESEAQGNPKRRKSSKGDDVNGRASRTSQEGFAYLTGVARYQVDAASSVGRMRGVALLIRDDRVNFWEHMTLTLPGGKWVLAGDWNSVVNPLDFNPRSNKQSEEEVFHFHNFCTTFGLRDAREVARRTEGPRYTRAQVRDGKFCWSRLDRFYTSDHQVRKEVHYSQFCSSDHLPLSITLELDAVSDKDEGGKRSAYFKADKWVVQENLEALKQTWEEVQQKNRDVRAAERFLKGWVAVRKHIKACNMRRWLV